MSNNPLVSILVPIFNVERYLRECLDSIRLQTLRDIEVICINDGSTDGSRAIIEEYVCSDMRFRVIDKENSGYGASMNIGLQACRGVYVGIVESDDYIEPQMFESLYHAAEQHQAQVAKCDFFLFWSKPQVVNERFYWVDDVNQGHINPQIDRDVFYRKPSIWSAIYRRDFLQQNDIGFLETPGASYQDASFNFKVWASCDNAVLLNEPLLHYRQDNEASSVNAPGKVFCVCDEYAEMHRYLDCHWMDRGYLRETLCRMRFDTYEWNYGRLNEALRSDFLPRMRQDVIDDGNCGYFNSCEFDANKMTARSILIEHPELYPALYSTRDVTGMKAKFRLVADEHGLLDAVRLLVRHIV